MPVTGAPIPFSKTKGWNIELTLAKDYFLDTYMSSNTKVIQKITQKEIPESAVLLSKSTRKVYYSAVENLFYEDMTGGNVVLVSKLYVEDEAIWETMQSNLTTGWYIVK